MQPPWPRWWRCRCWPRLGWRGGRYASRSWKRWAMREADASAGTPSAKGGGSHDRGRKMKLPFMLTLLALARAAIAADDVATLLQDADRYRTGQDDLQVETQVSTFNRDG